MDFLTEPEPVRGVAIPVAPGISRIVAANPGPMTYHGTNTYLIAGADGVSVLDPGPRRSGACAGDPARDRRAGGAHPAQSHPSRPSGRACRPCAPPPAPRPTVTVTARSPAFTPDIALDDGDTVAGWAALHTPGHAAEHLCFARADGVILTADHVMTWSTSVVSPPAGDMGAYVAQLRRLLARDDRLLLPGHGPPLADPRAYLTFLLAHREQREAAVLAAIAAGRAHPGRPGGSAVSPARSAACGVRPSATCWPIC